LEENCPDMSTSLYGGLQLALSKCGAFASEGDLRSVFCDPRLREWADALSQFDNRASRIRDVINFLYIRSYGATQENALVLLLRVLAEEFAVDDAHRQELDSLAGHLEAEISSPPVAIQKEVRYSPSLDTPYEKFTDYFKSIVSELSRKAIDDRKAFYRVRRELVGMADREDAWESCRGELPRDCLEARLLEVRVDAYLRIQSPVGALRELVSEYPSLPEVFQVAAGLCYELADETAKCEYEEAKQEAEREFDDADRHLEELKREGYSVRDIEHAESRLKDAESELDDLRLHEFYKDVLETALQWIQRAQQLGADDESLSEVESRIERRLRLSTWLGDACAEKWVPTRENLRRWYEMIMKGFDEEDLRNLCLFDLDEVDYDGLSGNGKRAKVRELIERFKRHGAIPELIEACSQVRPNLCW